METSALDVLFKCRTTMFRDHKFDFNHPRLNSVVGYLAYLHKIRRISRACTTTVLSN